MKNAPARESNAGISGLRDQRLDHWATGACMVNVRQTSDTIMSDAQSNIPVTCSLQWLGPKHVNMRAFVNIIMGNYGEKSFPSLFIIYRRRKQLRLIFNFRRMPPFILYTEPRGGGGVTQILCSYASALIKTSKRGRILAIGCRLHLGVNF